MLEDSIIKGIYLCFRDDIYIQVGGFLFAKLFA